MNKGQSNIVI